MNTPNPMVSSATHYADAVAAAKAATDAAFADLARSFGMALTKNGAVFRAGGRYCANGQNKTVREVYDLRNHPWRIVTVRGVFDERVLRLMDREFDECRDYDHYYVASDRFRDEFGNVAIVAAREVHEHWHEYILCILTGCAEEK